MFISNIELLLALCWQARFGKGSASVSILTSADVAEDKAKDETEEAEADEGDDEVGGVEDKADEVGDGADRPEDKTDESEEKTEYVPDEAETDETNVVGAARAGENEVEE